MWLVKQSEFGKEVPCFEVEATAVEPMFDRLYSYLFGLPANANAEENSNKALPNAIFILNLDKVCSMFCVEAQEQILDIYLHCCTSFIKHSRI